MMAMAAKLIATVMSVVLMCIHTIVEMATGLGAHVQKC